MPPDNVESLTDDEEAQDDDVMINNGLLNDVCGMVQVHTNFLSEEDDDDDEVEGDDNSKEEQTKSRAQNENKKMRT